MSTGIRRDSRSREIICLSLSSRGCITNASAIANMRVVGLIEEGVPFGIRRQLDI